MLFQRKNIAKEVGLKNRNVCAVNEKIVSNFKMNSLIVYQKSRNLE